MSDKRHQTDQPCGTRTEVPNPESETRAKRWTGFDCCGTTTSTAREGCPCSSIMRRHPGVMGAIIVIMGLAILLIPAGAILGIIAFLRMI